MKTDLGIFADELVKVAKKQTERKSYLNQMVTLAPAAGIQALSEVPKGYVDKRVQWSIDPKSKLKTPKSVSGPKPSALRTGIGRGAGRLGAALVTTPMFLSGIKQIAHGKTKKERREGALKVIGSGAAFSAIKGGIEGGIVTKSLDKVKQLGKVRGIIGTAAAASLAYGIAKNLRTKKKKESFYNKIIVPGMMGAGIGALKGGIEGAYLEYKDQGKGLKGKPMLKRIKNLTPRSIAGFAGGRAAAGALGAVVISEIADKFMKKASVTGNPMLTNNSEIVERPGELYSKMLMWARKQSDGKITKMYDKMGKGDPEKTPTRRAMYYALYDDLSMRGKSVRKPALRDKVHGPSVGDSGVGTAAGIVALRYAPMALNDVVSSLKPNHAETILRDAMDNMIYTSNINRGVGRGSFDPSSNTIFAPKSAHPGTLAHELGHAKAGPKRIKYLQSKLSGKAFTAGKILALTVPLTAVALSSDPSFATKEELKAKASVTKAAGLVAGGLMAPVIAEEVIASKKGIEFLREAAVKKGIKASTATLSGLKRMLPGLGTYAAPLIVPILASHYLSQRAKKIGGRK